MAGINDLITSLNDNEGIARSNRVNLVLPGLTEQDLVNTTVTTFNLPQRQLMTSEYMHDTQMKSYVYGSTNNNIQLNFKGTNSWRVYKYFNDWTEIVLNSDSYTLAYKNAGYGKPVGIYPLNQLNEETCHFNLENAFPITVGSIEMGNDLENQILSFSVELLYDRYYFDELLPPDPSLLALDSASLTDYSNYS